MTLRSLLAATIALLLLVPSVALAHDERESVFPDGSGTTPTYRSFDEANPRLVVCKGDSDDRIAQISDLDRRTFNEARLAECEYEHIQAAVDAVTEQGTTIYVLPGEYREEPSHNPPCTEDYEDGTVVEYDLIVSCGEVINLITVAGDDPADEDITCDNALCDLQIEGTGEVPQDTKVVGGFNDDGDWVKHNGLKADRADGFALVNMAFELFSENAIYVHETDGYLLERVEANFNDLYGILTFTSDHGVISNCETHHNGDSGVYPGSAADVNQENDEVTGEATFTETGPLERWSVEIFNCDTHHNALGFSGTAGNSVWFHDNLVHHNGAGYVTDSFVPDHPGMPQDHAFLENNRIFANNTNYYPNVQGEDAPCQAERPADRGHQDGVVCPAFPVPVGTGVLIAGGSHNLVRTNLIYDNWRNGVMQFWVPGAVRDDFSAFAQYDTSNHNHYLDNSFGLHPTGATQPNGTDVWWDDQGIGNCWQGNTSTTEDGELSSNTTFPALPDCDSGGSVNQAPNPAKSAPLVPCAEYRRGSNPEPEGCDWFDDPQEPEGREAVAGEQDEADGGAGGVDTAEDDGALAATGGGGLLALLGLGALVAAGRARRQREDSV